MLTLMLAMTSMMAATATELPKELQTYKLDNGLTVILWEDHEQPDCEGYVVTRAGAIDEPAEYTGLAHYLEHMLFKGTQEIGALDWEKEKPLYDSIIALYDEYAEATDPKVRKEIATHINKLSIEAGKYANPEDFWFLMDGMGAEEVNAYTSYDVTCYHNHFNKSQMERWLTLFSDRLINPVFRTFQAELETVFEEYNRGANNPQSKVGLTLWENVYAGHPYERSVIGKPEHLKNPRLSKLIEFYNTWYVPNNMALIIVGDFNAEAVKPLIAKTFNRLVPKELPARGIYGETSFAGNPHKTFKMGYNPEIIWAYKGVKEGHEDQTALEFAVSLLSNGMGTGLLDKLELDGKISSVGAFNDSRRDQGRIIIDATPYYDINVGMFESDKATERMVMAEVDKLKNGQIEDWQIAAVKKEYAQSYKLSEESTGTKMSQLVHCFTYGLPLTDIFEENEKVQALTKEEIAAVARKYFNADHLTVTFEENLNSLKPETVDKPEIEPLQPIEGVQTEYFKNFWKIPADEVEYTYNDFNDVKVTTIGSNVKLHYTKNDKNDIFSLTLRYGVGSKKIPMLEYIPGMMNTAGTMIGNLDAQQFRLRLAELGAQLGYSSSENYFYIQIIGEDSNIEEITRLVNQQLLAPKLEQEQLDNVKGRIVRSRYLLPHSQSAQASALLQYALYGKNSPYVDVVPFKDIYDVTLPQVQSFLGETRSYGLDVFYCGTRTPEEVTNVLPLVEGMRPAEPYFERERQTYDKPTLYFHPAKVQQATLYFYINGKPYTIDTEVANEAFSQYFGGGFTGLVLNEIRVKRSMAYTASGGISTPALPGNKDYFIGYVGTQSDKVEDAIDVYMNLLNNMPVDSAMMKYMKPVLRQACQSKPSMRGKAQTYEYWQRMGYTDDPARMMGEEVAQLTFADVEKFYKENIQGKPVTVVIVGDPKKVNIKSIEKKLGCKAIKSSPTTIFAPFDIHDLF